MWTGLAAVGGSHAVSRGLHLLGIDRILDNPRDERVYITRSERIDRN